jgi:O-antigen/teichoic acid export membrane protein
MRHAVPLAVAAALVGVASLLTTVFVAHVLTTRGYGALVVLIGLFTVLSLPGSALLVGVVRRVSAWEAGGARERVRPWMARVHRVGGVALVAWAALMVLLRVPVAHALSLQGPSGVAEILTAGGVWVLVSIDRGLLQARRNYKALSVNLVIEATTRTALTVGLATALGLEGAALGLLFAELATAVHARLTSTRTWAQASPAVPGAVPLTDVSAADEVHTARDLVADLVTALGSLALLAVLQNADVILLGSQAPHRSGAYGAISVPSKALVFGALVLVNYLLPEATIRHQQGSHALRQLGHTFVVVAIPCVTLLGLALVAPHRLLGVVFGHRLTAASPAFATLVLAMVLLCVTVVLTIYLLGVGWRWVVAVLGAGAAALVVGAALAGGRFLPTARADLGVQAVLCAAMVVAFVTVHRRTTRARSGAGRTGIT